MASTQYDSINYFIEFLRVTPNENVVKIKIQLEKEDEHNTKSHISYQYTALNEKQNQFIKNDLVEKSNKSLFGHWGNVKEMKYELNKELLWSVFNVKKSAPACSTSVGMALWGHRYARKLCII